MKRYLFAASVVGAGASIALAACGNDGSPAGADGADAGVVLDATVSSEQDALDAPSVDAGSSERDGGRDGSTNPGTDGGKDAATPFTVVVNEISGKGSEWIELYNAGAASMDVSGYMIADLEKDGGGPKWNDGILFPAGTVLGPGGYILLAKQGKDAGPTPTCPGDGGAQYCFASPFGISNSVGDRIYLLQPNDAGVAEQEDYPANTVTVSGRTWGRYPNGTGAFTVTLATPGDANVDAGM